jgi:hypothetical protein
VHLDADRYTFHPDLPGPAFMGMWDQSGPYFVPLELQARWIATRGAGRSRRKLKPNSGCRSMRTARSGGRQRKPNELGGADLCACRRGRAAAGELAAHAPRVAVRSPRAELFPARGPGCAARCPGPIRL